MIQTFNNQNLRNCQTELMQKFLYTMGGKGKHFRKPIGLWKSFQGDYFKVISWLENETLEGLYLKY
ncbi:unnamed protein product [Paramecium octaurelia]|uniref:Uncharacterized protein n=1 Tax=Paramecium octaurelia TaxID=43137 RepID=A0A8S1W714_PAROT|nr:unnamed protein product [Paramecium octaurelia]